MYTYIHIYVYIYICIQGNNFNGGYLKTVFHNILLLLLLKKIVSKNSFPLVHVFFLPKKGSTHI